ncbi:RICIN domain-containing protein [Streptomyces nojiriensis]|uniref:RICIN domain-containing protein n=1 Tax=Streptomyces nojiriensis TaxID=66374 RepID=UPI0035E02085
MAGRTCPSGALFGTELESLLALRRSFQEKKDATGPRRDLNPGPVPESAAAVPNLATISANAYAWGYDFILPGAAVTALRDSGTFKELLGTMPPEVEPVIPVVEAHLASDLDSLAALDQGAGVILTATWTAPDTLVPRSMFWAFISTWLGQDLVLDVEGASPQSGAQLVINPYNASGPSNQSWSYVNNLYLYNGSGKVVEIADSDPSDSARVQINDYTGAPNQQWALAGDGLIRSLMNGNVLDVSGGLARPGTPVISYHPKYPATMNPPTNQGWSSNLEVDFLCNNLVTVIKNNTPVIMTVQGYPQKTTYAVYGDAVQILSPGEVAVYTSNYYNAVAGDNAMNYVVYAENASGVSVSFDAHQHYCGLAAGEVWVDNVTGANGYSLNSPKSDWYEGDYHYELPGTIVSSLEWNPNG